MLETLQLIQNTTSLRKLLLILLQTRPLAQFFLVALIITQIAHSATVHLWIDAVRRTSCIAHGRMAFQSDKRLDKCVKVGLRLCVGEDVEAWRHGRW